MVRDNAVSRTLLTKKIFLIAFSAFLLFFFSLPCQAASDGYTIGVIMTGDIQYYRDVHEAFMSRLRKEGYADRIEVIMQKPYPDPMSLSNAARKLIAHEVDVILVYGTPAAIAVSREKSKIPVIYAGVYEPLIQKIAGKNVAGTCMKPSVSGLLRYLRGMATIGNLAVIYSDNEVNSAYQMKEIMKIGEQYRMKIHAINLKRHQDVKNSLAGKKYDALFITESSIANVGMSSIMDFAREQKIPTASLLPDKNSHIIVALYASPKELGDKSAEKVMKALTERSAERIKSGSSQDIELVFDLKELLGMGLKIPMDLVTEATRIIQ